MRPAPLGIANGPGFGSKDVDVFKLGVAWNLSDALTLRVGYNKGDNPITSADMSFNILAPGVITSHYMAGFTVAVDKESEITGMLMIAPGQRLSGGSLFNSPAFFGPCNGGSEGARAWEPWPFVAPRAISECLNFSLGLEG